MHTFVHGASNGGTSWAPLAARLTGLRCILLDRPGCALSEPVEPAPDADGLPLLAESFGGPEIARQLVARIPGAELELLPGAGHARGWTTPITPPRS